MFLVSPVSVYTLISFFLSFINRGYFEHTDRRSISKKTPKHVHNNLSFHPKSRHTKTSKLNTAKTQTFSETKIKYFHIEGDKCRYMKDFEDHCNSCRAMWQAVATRKMYGAGNRKIRLYAYRRYRFKCFFFCLLLICFVLFPLKSYFLLWYDKNVISVYRKGFSGNLCYVGICFFFLCKILFRWRFVIFFFCCCCHLFSHWKLN